MRHAIPPTMPAPLLRRSLAALLVVALAATLASCASRKPAPVEDRSSGQPRATAPAATAAAPKPPAEPDWRPQSYTVKRGDTLYQIALDHGLDYRELAGWNSIENPNRIFVGQVLRLTAPGSEGPGGADAATGVVTAPLRAPPPVAESRGAAGPPTPPPTAAAAPASPATGGRNTDSYKSSPKAIKEPYSAQAARDLAKADAPVVVAKAEPSLPSPPPVTASPAPSPERATAAPAAAAPTPAPSGAADDDEGLDWIWPAKGKVVASFNDGASLKGIDIAGNLGQPVVAAAPGKVVYAGSGLRGYGKLVIIKHNKTFLSAYAHNRDILVKEGQQVTRGQKIAEMGNSDAEQVKLHFEIRRLGKPMDPAKYLPPA
jgi:lipoprotein NlpD